MQDGIPFFVHNRKKVTGRKGIGFRERSAAMEKGEFQSEVEHLGQVEGIIQSKLEKLHREKAPLREEVVQERKEMWVENRHGIGDFDDVIFMSTQEAAVSFAERRLEWNELEIQRMTKMAKSPYFGRVDFEECETGEKDRIYIGIYSLMQEETQEVYVVDWRAPIASMFYQFDLGPAWYQVNNYKNEVEITGKRQYKIEDGHLLSVYDTESSMYDDILGDVLSNHSDHKLKVIIGSIQKEQNAAIRSDTKKSCLIYGLAGSGKTSIGLHRLAYVLYCNRDTIKSENVLILSNNHIFGSYISTILPDLGEKPAQTKVFADLLEAGLGEGLEVEDYYSQLKSIESPYAEERKRWIQVKYSADLLEFCIRYFADFPFRIPEIRYGENILATPEAIRRKLDAEGFPDFQSRFERLKVLVRKAIEDYFTEHKEEMCREFLESREDVFSEKEARVLYRRTMHETIQSAQEDVVRLNRLNAKKQMREVFAEYLRQTGEGDREDREQEVARLSDSLERGRLLYEDALFYLFIKVLMGEVAPFPAIYHTVIDESQDYNLLQLCIMKRLFPKSSFTLLGDIYQTVNSLTTIQRYQEYERVFGAGLIQIRLSKCYRSSSDINALAFRLIDEAAQPIAEKYSYFARPVKKPRYIISRDMFSCLVPVLKQLEKYHSVAVIVNGDEEALGVKSYLCKHMEAQLIISPEDEMKDRLVIIPLLLAKGLEFDAVILFDFLHSMKPGESVEANKSREPDESNETSESGEDIARFRRKVYLGCTRALHELYFIEREGLPDSLEECAPYLEVTAS
jgi:DNA helicase-2/ATP-dependent DNA helicase PcrA